MTAFGTLITSFNPHFPPIIKNLGLDFVFIDTEHIALDRSQVSWMCRAYRAMDITPIVRITRPDPYEATCMIDGGACGIIAPYVETVEQVKQLRGAVKLRPLKGDKLRRALDGEKLEPEVETYLKNANKENLLIINIESKPAMENLDAILQQPDIDCILIGPHDLSINLGIPEQWTNPIFDNAVREIISKSRKKGLGAGIHHSFGIKEEIEWVKFGANLVLHSSDLVALKEKMREDFNLIKQSIGHKDDKNDKQGAITELHV